MAMPVGKSRLSLGDLMLFIALAAVVLASTIGRDRYSALQIPHAGATCVGLACLFAYRRLSPWAWVAIAGVMCGPLSEQSLLVSGFPSPGARLATPPDAPLWDLIEDLIFLISSLLRLRIELGWVLSLARPLLFWVGIGMTLRAAHRRVVNLEAQLTGRPPVGSSVGEPIVIDPPA